MKILDSHVHFWEPDQLTYAWLADVPDLQRPFLPTDYREATKERVTGLVFVQADCLPEQGLAEVDWVTGLRTPVAAIVAFAPLEEGMAVRPYLEALKKRSLVKGVRRLLQAEADDFASQPDFVRGVNLLAEYDLRFDICIKHHQLTAVTSLVRQCPHVQFVLDHIGKPDIVRGAFDTWQAQLQTLAQFDNVLCKLSGVITEADWANWTVAEIRPYLDHALNCFGIDRLMFGSDWPVVTLAGSFEQWLDILLGLTRHYPELDRRKLFYKNARIFYGIEAGD